MPETDSPTHAAFLRGINVGTAKRMAMADLRRLLERLDYAAVRTLLNSGNVVFRVAAGDRRDHAATIEAAIEKAFGFASKTTVLSGKSIGAIVRDRPFATVAVDGSRFFVMIFADPKGTRVLEPLRQQTWGAERIAIGSGVAYLWCPDGISQSPLNEAASRLARDTVTTRNWNTFTKIAELVC